jgi:2-oxoglutarate ferredoxin oxidoreductase subunit alpha
VRQLQREPRLIQGNLAMAEGALYAGYPITLSSEIASECARILPQSGGVYLQMEDEIASLAAVVGASLAGAKAFTATSGPGFSLMQENLGMAVMGEVPCVVIDVQRSGPATGLATKPAQSDIMQVRWGRHGDQAVIALSPSSAGECFCLMVQAFNLAERFRVPVVFAAEEIVAHMRENFVSPAPGEIEVVDRKAPQGPPGRCEPFARDAGAVAPVPAFGSGFVFHVSTSMHGPDGFSNNDPAVAAWKVERLHRKLDLHRDEIVMTREFYTDDAEVLFIAFGAVTRAARAAALEARKNGVKAGLLQLITIWPFPDREIAALAEKARTVVVPEMNYAGQAALEVRRILGPEKDIRRVNKYNGRIIAPRDVLAALDFPAK